MEPYYLEPQGHDPLNFMPLLIAAFPDALIKAVTNFDDFYYGYEICPLPGVLVKFMVKNDEPLRIKVFKYVMNPMRDGLSEHTIFKGSIPPTNDMEPDLDFIQKLLENWNSIG